MTDYVTEFTGKQIIRAVYTNESHDTIKVEYYNGDTNADGTPTIIPMYISSDPNATYLKALFAEGYDFERVQKETVINNQEQAIAWRKMIKMFAVNEIEKVKKQYDEKFNELAASGVTDFSAVPVMILENNANEEYLFKAKIALFELPAIKEIKDTKGKAKIRGSKTLLDLFTAVNELITPKE